MRRLLLLLVPLLLAFRPGGEPEFFSWVPPTTRVDGTALNPATDISAYTLKCLRDGVPAYTQMVGSGAANYWPVPAATFAPGTWICQLYATDQEARESDGSLGVEFLVTTYSFVVAPMPPSGLSIG
jgi:hypothetical protein